MKRKKRMLHTNRQREEEKGVEKGLGSVNRSGVSLRRRGVGGGSCGQRDKQTLYCPEQLVGGKEGKILGAGRQSCKVAQS